MKPGARRLGRGLGAFLDFGPAGDDGPAYAPGREPEGAKSVLETSAPPPVPAPPPPPRETRVAVAPPPPPEPARAQPVAAENPLFEDELVGGLTFPDVELE